VAAGVQYRIGIRLLTEITEPVTGALRIWVDP